MTSRALRRCRDALDGPSGGPARVVGPSAYVWLLPMMVATTLVTCVQSAHACSGSPLVANIGQSLSSGGPWSTASTRSVNKGTALHFHALDENNVPLEDAGGADLDWDYCYPTGYDNNKSLTGCISHPTPGNRIVCLRVVDGGYTSYDTFVMRVELEVETDWMSGYALPDLGTFPGRWAGAGYSNVYMDPDKDTDCDYYEYLLEDLGGMPAVREYLGYYAKQNPALDLYMIGADRWVSSGGPGGVCVQGKWSVICVGAGSGLGVELHECACHDLTVGAIGHCTSGDTCACRAEGGELFGNIFCSSCKNELKADILSRGPKWRR